MYRYALVFFAADGTVQLVCSFLCADASTFALEGLTDQVRTAWPDNAASARAVGSVGAADLAFAAKP